MIQRTDPVVCDDTADPSGPRPPTFAPPDESVAETAPERVTAATTADHRRRRRRRSAAVVGMLAVGGIAIGIGLDALSSEDGSAPIAPSHRITGESRVSEAATDASGSPSLQEGGPLVAGRPDGYWQPTPTVPGPIDEGAGVALVPGLPDGYWVQDVETSPLRCYRDGYC